jgi:multiple sugar transport system substrate-binding protein
VAAASLLAATACGTGTGAPTAPTAADGDGKGVLRVVTGTDLTSKGVRRDLIEEAAADLGVRVSVVELPDDTDRQRSQLVAALQAGNPDDYDIVNLDAAWTAEFAAQDLVAPLTGDLLDSLDVREDQDVWAPVRDTVGYDGKAWAVPWNTDVGLLYYRADLLGTDPELRTWEKLTRTVHGHDRDTGPSGGALVTGLATQLAPYEGLTVNTHEAVWRNGGEIVGADGEVRVSQKAAERGLRQLMEAFRKDGDQLPVLDKESLRTDETGTTERFLAGEALTMRNWPVARFRLAEHLAKSDRDGDDAPRYGVTALPDGEGPAHRGHSVLGGQNLAIVAGTPDVEAARDLIERLTSRAAGVRLHEGGFVPARRSALPGGCPEHGRSLPDRVPQGTLEEQYVEALCWSMEHARPRPSTPYYASVTRAIQDVMTSRLRAAPEPPPVGEQASTEDLRELLEDSLRGR